MASILRSWACRARVGRAPHPSALRLAGPRSFSSTAPAARRQDRPLRMAVVGSGPAGFYTAYRVMSRVQGTRVDMYEALPVPFGLVRFGVAPDHPEVKNCQDKFEEVAASPDFTFVGNVSVGATSAHAGGCSVPLDALMRHYDAVVFAYGASRDRTLGIPGEAGLGGVYSAREFVGWYNGLPEFAGLAPDLTRGDEAVIIGQGNVALDVARMLLENVDVLRKSDITDAAIETLSKSRVKRVHVVGRRGPMQAAYTIKEVRELMKLRDVGFHPIDMNLVPDEISKLPRAQKRLMEIIVKGSAAKVDDASKTWSLDFCLSPSEFLGDSSGNIKSTIFERTALETPFDPASKVSGTGEKLEIPSALAFRSIGYKSVALPGFAEAGILFNDRKGTIQNDGLGRVFTQAAGDNSPAHLGGVYCAGWVKRGPTGVIASTMQDAFSTGDAIAEDWASEASFLSNESAQGWDGVKHAVDSHKCTVIAWEDWHKIDKAEKERGRLAGKEREKFTTTAEMLTVAA